jgi:predicted transcriptional regulator
MTEDNNLVELTADIVSAHVSNNSVAIGDVANLVQQVHEALSKLGNAPEATGPAKREPVVSAKASVKPDYLTCMVCGKKQKTLKRHIQNAHQMTPAEYRAEFDLPGTYPMVAPAYSQRRGELARSIGLGRRPKSEGGSSDKGSGRKLSIRVPE